MHNMLVCLTSITLLSGCAALTGISPKYPQDWPPLVNFSGEECPDLSGRYQNLASYSFLWMTGANSLAFWLGLETIGTDEVVLVNSSTTLQIEALNGQEIIAEKLLSKDSGDFSCSDSALVLPKLVYKDADGTGGYWSESRLYLRRAQGETLIGEEKTSGIGTVFWLIPVGGRQTFWYQWKQDQ